jgi:hypothetical protein
MTNRTISTLLLGSILLACSPLAAVAAEPVAAPAARQQAGPDKSEFIRFKEDAQGGGTLDTAIASYKSPAGDVVVHLVAAVHVGEADYYKKLAKTFDTYDALLFELVKAKDAPVPGENVRTRPGGTRIRGAAAIGGLQSFLKNTLKLESQLDSINYDRPNFIHADLDAETFNKLQEERGESMFGLMLRSIVQEMTRQQAGKGAAPPSMFEILSAMGKPDSARRYKLILARQFVDMDSKFEGLEGERGSVIISERNKAAIKVLEQTIADGKRTIGVFYGAGHMRGIEEHLVGRMGFKRVGVEWRTAWDMTAAPAPLPAEAPAKEKR